jgi:hypothetical protein
MCSSVACAAQCSSWLQLGVVLIGCAWHANRIVLCCCVAGLGWHVAAGVALHQYCEQSCCVRSLEGQLALLHSLHSLQDDDNGVLRCEPAARAVLSSRHNIVDGSNASYRPVGTAVFCDVPAVGFNCSRVDVLFLRV